MSQYMHIKKRRNKKTIETKFLKYNDIKKDEMINIYIYICKNYLL